MRTPMNDMRKWINLLEDESIGGKINKEFQNITILDLGCGNGFSMLVFEDKGFDRIIGVDISADMLKENLKMQDKRENHTRI